jgi:hypothetical protein
MTVEPKQPQRVPTLTEVIIDLPADGASSAAPSAAARNDAQVAPETLMAEALMQETRMRWRRPWRASMPRWPTMCARNWRASSARQWSKPSTRKWAALAAPERNVGGSGRVDLQRR